MARNIRIINARDFVKAKPDGALNLEESEQLLRDVVGVSDPLDEFDILVDTREAASTLTATDLWSLADRLVRYPDGLAQRSALTLGCAASQRSRALCSCSAMASRRRKAESVIR